MTGDVLCDPDHNMPHDFISPESHSRHSLELLAVTAAGCHFGVIMIARPALMCISDPKRDVKSQRTQILRTSDVLFAGTLIVVVTMLFVTFLCFSHLLYPVILVVPFSRFCLSQSISVLRDVTYDLGAACDGKKAADIEQHMILLHMFMPFFRMGQLVPWLSAGSIGERAKIPQTPGVSAGHGKLFNILRLTGYREGLNAPGESRVCPRTVIVAPVHFVC